MDEQFRELYDALVEYKGRLDEAENPEEVRVVLDSVLGGISGGEPVDPDELETIAAYIEEFDQAYPEYEELLDCLREFQERLH